MNKIVITVPEEAEGARLDKFLAESIDYLTRSALQKVIASGGVTIDGREAAKSRALKAGEDVSVTVPDAVELDVEPQNIPLDIYYEDDDLLVVYKPKGMVVHPAPGNPDGTMVNALLYHCGSRLSSIGGVIRPGIVHRIDKDTSGLLVVAKDDETHRALSEKMSRHDILREYHAVVYGNLKEDSGFVEASIGRDKNDRKKMAVTDQNAKYAYTEWRVLERFGNFTYIACRLKTGRTHQIRVHMASIGHPLAGDPVYGPRSCITELHGQCLHAKMLGFEHPATGQWMEFDSDLPPYFEKYLQKLRKGRG